MKKRIVERTVLALATFFVAATAVAGTCVPREVEQPIRFFIVYVK